MTNLNLGKKLGLITLAGLALVAGSAQAHGWYGHDNPYLPVVAQAAPYQGDHHAFGDRFERDFSPRHENHASIDQRQQQQMQSIRDGMAAGRISRHEAHDLAREQMGIERTQRRYLADGRLSRDEWIRLDRMLDQSAANLRAEKHDRNGR